MSRKSGTVRALVALLALAPAVRGQEPPALNPFGPRPGQVREDAIPGYVELSDGTIHPGQVYLTRDHRLSIFDEEQKRNRDVPLNIVERVDCSVLKEWMEREWRFLENASDRKVYTGRAYPAREYAHRITLKDRRTIEGPLSGIVYVKPSPDAPAERFLLHKRDKGPVGSDLKSLLYVRTIHLGDAALAEGMRRASGGREAGADRDQSR